jgi:hypothetical protein
MSTVSLSDLLSKLMVTSTLLAAVFWIWSILNRSWSDLPRASFWSEFDYDEEVPVLRQSVRNWSDPDFCLYSNFFPAGFGNGPDPSMVFFRFFIYIMYLYSILNVCAFQQFKREITLSDVEVFSYFRSYTQLIDPGMSYPRKPLSNSYSSANSKLNLKKISCYCSFFWAYTTPLSGGGRGRDVSCHISIFHSSSGLSRLVNLELFTSLCWFLIFASARNHLAKINLLIEIVYSAVVSDLSTRIVTYGTY